MIRLPQDRTIKINLEQEDKIFEGGGREGSSR